MNVVYLSCLLIYLMRSKKHVINRYWGGIVLVYLITACNSLSEKTNSYSDADNISDERNRSKAALSPQNQSQYKLGDTIAINLELNAGYKPDSVQFLFDDVLLTHAGLSAALPTQNRLLGKHNLTAVLYGNNKSEKLASIIYLLSDVAPKIYNYQIVNVYPHDTTAFTEGLEYRDGCLYESTGQYGNSDLRKTELTTGKILKKKTIDKRYFGEGLTKFKNNLIQLTWKENTGFVYDLNFNLIKTFSQNNTEGWGLCNDGKYLLKSDGSNKIYFLDPETYKEEKHIEVYDNQLPVRRINELEYIDKRIYANVWETNSILMINPENGQVTGTVDVTDILTMYAKPATIDVLNGIAYDEKNKRIFITGKNWPKIFEIKVMPR